MDDGVGRRVFCLLCMQIRMNWRQVCAHESDDDGKNGEEKFGVIMCRFKMKAMIGKRNNDGDKLCQRLEVNRMARG